MTDSARDFDQELIRLIAQNHISNLEDYRTSLIGQHTDIFKWLNASLLAINGAAALSLIGNNGIDYQLRILAGIAFCLGLGAALSIGVAAQHFSSLSIEEAQKQVRYWISVATTAKRDLNAEESLNSNQYESLKRSWIVPVLGWISGLFFVCGLAFLGAGLAKQVEPNDIKSSSINCDYTHIDRVAHDR